MKFLLNGLENPFPLDKSTPLGPALQTLQEKHLLDTDVITAISVDGQPLTSELLAQWQNRPLDQFHEINLETQKRHQYAAVGLRLIAHKLQAASPTRQQIADHLSQGHSPEAMPLLTDYLQTWSTVQLTLASACRLMNLLWDSVPNNNSDSQPSASATPELMVRQAVKQLSEKLQELQSALAAADLVLLADLLNYDFANLAHSWLQMLTQLADQFDPPTASP